MHYIISKTEFLIFSSHISKILDVIVMATWCFDIMLYHHLFILFLFWTFYEKFQTDIKVQRMYNEFKTWGLFFIFTPSPLPAN